MDRGFRSVLLIVSGIALIIVAFALHAVWLEAKLWNVLPGVIGVLLLLWGATGLYLLKGEIVGRRRREVALFTVGAVAALLAFNYLCTQLTFRFDLTQARLNSLSDQTETMLARLDKPIDITFFHDARLRDTVDLYERIAEKNEFITLELHDPTINPAQARLMGVQFPGTSVMQSEGRTLKVNGNTETDIANGILKISRGATQRICFLDGHGEADPFSQEAHDHVEGQDDDHSHGLGANYILHEQHGMAKARHSLETLNYEVRKVSLLKEPDALGACTVLVVAGAKIALRQEETLLIDQFLAKGGNAFFMLEPFVTTHLEPLLLQYGIIADNAIVIDEASHYWTDVSAPAVTSYNNHQITRKLPLTFYPGTLSFSPTDIRVPGTAVIPLVNSSQNSFSETSQNRAKFDEGVDLAGPRTLMLVANRRPITGNSADKIKLGPVYGAASTIAVGTNNEQTLPESSASVTERSRIAVVGDADFATNSFFHFLGNGDIFLNTISYLAGQENLIGIEPKTYDLPRLSVTNRQIKATFVLSVLFLPFLLAIAGTLVWWRQR